MPAHGPAGLSSLAQKTDDWFTRAQATLLGQVPCRIGCSSCCIGPFPITLLDERLLHEGLSQLSVDQRERIVERAHKQVSAMETVYPQLARSRFLDHWPDADIDQLISRFHQNPCPALGDDGLCGLYEYRPLTCRSMGIPAEQAGITNGACQVQTFVPIVRLSTSLRTEEDQLAQQEASALEQIRLERQAEGEELLLPYGFLPQCG
ncbi:MAG TPA: YkgJ family cysteine cluster protein [Nitrospira sp.]